jgi:UDP-N-acetylglucosamine transferase subunit ALG13
MIFLTVGVHNQQFNRILKEVDNLIGTKKLKDNVIAQTGVSDYIPKNYKSFDFAPFEKMVELNKKADIIISHAGVGTIIVALKNKKPIVVVPRLVEMGEHTDDHQVQLGKILKKHERIVVIENIANLLKGIKKAKIIRTKKFSPNSKIVKIVEERLKLWEND